MTNAQLALVAALAAIASGASLFGLFWILRQRRQAEPRTQPVEAGGPLPYRRTDALLTASERALYRALRPVAESAGAEVFPKVRLDDVIQVRKGAADYSLHRSRIAACGIDFLLCDQSRFVPLLAVQVEGIARDREKGEGLERFLPEALEAVGVGFLQVPARASYDEEELGALVHEQLAGASSRADEAAALGGLGGAPRPAPRATPYWLDSFPAAAPRAGASEPAGDALGSEEEESPALAPDSAAALADSPWVSERLGEEPALSPTSAAPGDSLWLPPDEEEGAAQAEALPGPQAPEEAQPPLAGEPLLPPAEEPRPADLSPEPPALPAVTGQDADAEARCPVCGQPLLPMQDVDTGEIVMACSRYPECAYVSPLEP